MTSSAPACRILVPGYSEVYPVDDLIWDNTNKALLFRADILNLHRLDDAEPGSTARTPGRQRAGRLHRHHHLIGIEFDENTDWGQLTILELKLLINLALQQFEARTRTGGSLPAIQRKHGRARIVLSGLECGAGSAAGRRPGTGGLLINFRRMFGNPRMDAVLGSVDGSVRFFGLTPTSMKLEGLERHQRLIDSYNKLHTARAKVAAASKAFTHKHFAEQVRQVGSLVVGARHWSAIHAAPLHSLHSHYVAHRTERHQIAHYVVTLNGFSTTI
jgi:ribosomal protein S12 methylthiotransferase accessory factor